MNRRSAIKLALTAATTVGLAGCTGTSDSQSTTEQRVEIQLIRDLRMKTCARIKFGQYDLTQLETILEDRAQWGLDPDAIDTERIELIADYAAGDARVAIGIFRNAARVAQQEGHQSITTKMIEDVVPEAKSEIRKKTTGKLTEHQQVLYETIKDAGGAYIRALTGDDLPGISLSKSTVTR